jgi:hypothetical protein
MLVALVSGLLPAAAQQPPTPVPGPRRVLVPQQSGRGDPKKNLSTNYRITFSGQAGGRPVGELSTLTCSPMVTLAGPLDASSTPTSFEVAGEIEEREDGQILFAYNISFSVPAIGAAPSPGGLQGGVPVSSNLQYQRHTVSGSLLMKPGKAYELLKAGGATHTVTIAPESDK